MTTRRDFLKAATLASSAALFPIRKVLSTPITIDYFGLNDFNENHSNAVFIFRTNIDVSANENAIRQTANDFGKTLFVPKNAGFSIGSNVSIKPNITSWSWQAPSGLTFDQIFPDVLELCSSSIRDLFLPPSIQRIQSDKIHGAFKVAFIRKYD